ncbi:MAG TPA: hypothetical protein DCQ50_19750 [Chryseobacterium sp.]|nr:hypothetical protein [Chryseobacterium sp.]
MRIHELHINDFKFFPEVEPDSPLLKIDGKHLLIYGENGSGKSTIYWALYTLLESSLKKSDDDIRKYFKKTGNESLVNIFSTGRNDTHIKAVLKDGANTKTYRVSRKSRDLSIRGNADVQESNMASDFINYRVLFQLHNLKHSKDNDLWYWFAEEVLPYVKIGNVPCLNTLEELQKGPDKVKNIHGVDVYPTASLSKSKVEQEAKDYQKYKAYKKEIKKWNDWLINFLNDITVKANGLIQNEFKYNFKIQLEFNQKAFKIKDELKFRKVGDNIEEYLEQKFDFPLPQIIISISEYEGIQNPNIKKPHTFLNEAKWSAIGLSIRLSILDIKLYTADLKALVIDDMLLSLDMRNRNIVLNLLLNNFSIDYQLILMSHDKSFFELAKKKINIIGQSSLWNIIEMYQDDTGAFTKPYFKPQKSNIQISTDFLIQHDYAACGIYLRKDIEIKLGELLPEKFKKEEKIVDGVTKLIDKRLNDLVIAFRVFCIEENIDFNPFIDLKVYKDLLLNPLAHNDVDAPFFRDELNSLIEITKELNKIKRGRLFHRSNKNMNFQLNKPDGSYFSVRMKSAEQIVLLEEDGRPERISIYSKCKVSSIENSGVITNDDEQFDTLREVYDEMCNRFGIPTKQDISRVFDYDGKTFDQKISELGI